jgi:hypothetical protein
MPILPLPTSSTVRSGDRGSVHGSWNAVLNNRDDPPSTYVKDGALYVLYILIRISDNPPTQSPPASRRRRTLRHIPNVALGGIASRHLQDDKVNIESTLPSAHPQIESRYAIPPQLKGSRPPTEQRACTNKHDERDQPPGSGVGLLGLGIQHCPAQTHCQRETFPLFVSSGGEIQTMEVGSRTLHMITTESNPAIIRYCS